MNNNGLYRPVFYRHLATCLLALASAVFFITPSLAIEVSGEITFEARAFTSPQYPGQLDNTASIALAPEFNWDLSRGSVTFTPFYRNDIQDPARSHADIRELYWQMSLGSWALNVGLRKEFWGVTESVHLVDVINQTDVLENLSGEEKLGQPLLSLTTDQSWGALSFYILPYFRERQFGGVESRFRPAVTVNDKHARYESAAEQNHIDVAVRYSAYIGNWDVGLSYFHGTNREPLLVENIRLVNDTRINEIVPFYQQMQQISSDLQYTTGSWLLKFEGLYRDSNSDQFFSAVGGFEYTFYGVAGSSWDIGSLVEYSKDDRQAATPFQNDLFGGVRLTPNDVAGTEFLAGFFYDLDQQSIALSIETNRRLGDHWSVSAELRAFQNVSDTDVLAAIREDNLLQVSLSYHF